MNPSSYRLALAFVERFGEVLPPPVTIHAVGSRLDLHADGVLLGGSDAVCILEEEDGRALPELAECVGHAVLDGIQDCTAEYLATPWPTEAGGEMAMPHARADAGRLHLWYGASEAAAVVRLRPIELDEVIDR
jgi:hypothetical protein